MRRLETFIDKKIEVKNITGGCYQTRYATSNGGGGTDTACDQNGDGKITKDEITYD